MTLANRSVIAALLTAAFLIGSSEAFYVPGVHPETFERGERIPLKVNSLTSIHTQVPTDYYRLPFCMPEGGPKMASENLGEFLTGSKIQDSPYVVRMLEEIQCRKLCQVKLSELEVKRLSHHISHGYHHNWIIDNIPSANVATKNGFMQKHYAGGFPIGFKGGRDSSETFLFNHVRITLDYHVRGDGSGNRVVGFGVEPISAKHKFEDPYYSWDGNNETVNAFLHQPMSTCHADAAGQGFLQQEDVVEFQRVMNDETIIYSYDVTWRESEVAWSSRWDVYLTEDHLIPPQVHWYSIVNSILVVLFLSLVVVSVLVRNLRRDIMAYNSLIDLADEELEGEEDNETGWKLVHADVFRPPTNNSMLYCVFIGTGVQLGITVFLAIVFSAFGFLSPARRGSLINATLSFYILSGVFAGYVSSRLYKAFQGRYWQMCTVFTATLFPGLAYAVFIVFNIMLAFYRSSASVPFAEVVIVGALWCCISIPLTFFGAYKGYKTETINFPTITSSIAREIPESSIALNPYLGMALTGIIPFASAYVELFFIMTSLWMNQFYYVFGFTLIVYIILIVTCAQVTVLSVYYQLCAENHRWWWYSFFCSGSVSFYMMGYSIIWFRALEASKVVMTYFLYFGYMALLSFGMLLVTGAVGSLTSLWFVRRIFSTIKID